ncbi:MAG: hypothetical protein KQJ78_19025 [Deltaproteobacteria bacterium]|nr:hypothetical protein [Deltaproteobacteria bacterium]
MPRKAISSAPARWLALLLLPALFWAGGAVFLHGRGPGYLPFNQDPEYPYLFASLNLVHSFTIDKLLHHPGITTMAHDGLVMAVQNALAGGGPLVDEVLRHPEDFMSAVRAVQLAEYALVLWLAGVLLLAVTGRWLPALAVQLTPLVSLAFLLNHTFVVRPEAQLLLLGPLLGVALAAHLAGRPASGEPWGFTALLALVYALFVATKITSLPLLVIPLALLPSWRTRLGFAALWLGLTALFLAPLWPHWDFFSGWFLQLIHNSGKYGTNQSFMDWGLFLGNLVTLVSLTPFYCLLVSLTGLAGLSAWLARKGDPRLAKCLVSVAAAQALGLVMVARSFPAGRYLIPTLALGGLNLVLLIWWAERFVSRRGLRGALAGVLAAAMLAGAGWDLRLGLNKLAERRTETVAREAFAAQVRPLILPSSTAFSKYVTSQEAALGYGLVYNYSLQPDFCRVWPEIKYFYSPYSQKTDLLCASPAPVSWWPRQVAAQDPGVLFWVPTRFLPPGLRLELLAELPVPSELGEGLFRVAGLLDDPQAPAQVVNRANGGRAAPSTGPRPEGESGD